MVPSPGPAAEPLEQFQGSSSTLKPGPGASSPANVEAPPRAAPSFYKALSNPALMSLQAFHGSSAALWSNLSRPAKPMRRATLQLLSVLPEHVLAGHGTVSRLQDPAALSAEGVKLHLHQQKTSCSILALRPTAGTSWPARLLVWWIHMKLIIPAVFTGFWHPSNPQVRSSRVFVEWLTCSSAEWVQVIFHLLC